MEKVFLLKRDGFYVDVEEAEVVVVESYDGGDTWYTVFVGDNKNKDYFTEDDIFLTYEAAEAIASRMNKEWEQISKEERIEAVAAHMAEVYEKCLI
jgi:hypothetical protein